MSTNKGAAHAFYCGSAIDDFGLTPSQFRVLFHLSRRKNKKDGIAKCGIRSIARNCEMQPRTALLAVRDLENRNIVKCEREPKRTNRYYIQPFENWKLLPKSTQINPGNCYPKRHKVLPKSTQILLPKSTHNCVEMDNVRYSGIPKGIPIKAKNAVTRNERSPLSRKVNHQKKPFAVAGEESIRELQKRHPRLSSSRPRRDNKKRRADRRTATRTLYCHSAHTLSTD